MLNIALTNLRKYNEGKIVYKWLELPATDDEIDAVKEEIGINEEYEEWFITDYDTDIVGLNIDKYENIEYLNELAERYEKLNSSEQETVEAVIEAHGYQLEDALDTVESGGAVLYRDCNTLEDLAKTLFNEGYFGDPDTMGVIANYIDFERLGEDLGQAGYTETSNGVVWVE